MSAVTVGKGQTYEMNALSKVTLSVVTGFEAQTTNVCVASLGADGTVVKTRAAPPVAMDTGGHEKWILVRRTRLTLCSPSRPRLHTPLI